MMKKTLAMALGQAPVRAQLMSSSAEADRLSAWYLSESPAMRPLETRA